MLFVRAKIAMFLLSRVLFCLKNARTYTRAENGSDTHSPFFIRRRTNQNSVLFARLCRSNISEHTHLCLLSALPGSSGGEQAGQRAERCRSRGRRPVRYSRALTGCQAVTCVRRLVLARAASSVHSTCTAAFQCIQRLKSRTFVCERLGILCAPVLCWFARFCSEFGVQERAVAKLAGWCPDRTSERRRIRCSCLICLEVSKKLQDRIEMCESRTPKILQGRTVYQPESTYVEGETPPVCFCCFSVQDLNGCQSLHDCLSWLN